MGYYADVTKEDLTAPKELDKAEKLQSRLDLYYPWVCDTVREGTVVYLEDGNVRYTDEQMRSDLEILFRNSVRGSIEFSGEDRNYWKLELVEDSESHVGQIKESVGKVTYDNSPFWVNEVI